MAYSSNPFAQGSPFFRNWNVGPYPNVPPVPGNIGFTSPLAIEAPTAPAQVLQTANNASRAAQLGLPERAAQGAIQRGSDGKNYQYVEMSGVEGASGGTWGWVETTTPLNASTPAQRPANRTSDNSQPLDLMATGDQSQNGLLDWIGSTGGQVSNFFNSDPMKAAGSWLGDRRYRLAALGGSMIGASNFGDVGDHLRQSMPGAMQMDERANMMRQQQEGAQTFARRLVDMGFPELGQMVADGWLEPGQAFNEMVSLQRDERERGTELARRESNASLLPPGPATDQARQAYLNGAIEWQEAYQWAQSGSMGGAGGEVDRWGFPPNSDEARQMNALVRQGIDEQTALGIVSGRYRLQTNPVDGSVSVVDMTSQTIRPVGGQEIEVPGSGSAWPQSGNQGGQTGTPPQTNLADGQPAQQFQGKTLWQYAQDATGVGSSVGSTLQNTLGQIPGAVGDMFDNPAQVEAQQAFNLFTRRLVQSLSLNPRFPVAEQQRIEAMIPTGPMVAPDTLRIALSQMDAEMGRIEQELRVAIQDPNATIQQKQADLRSLQAVQAARQQIGVPDMQGMGPNLALPAGVPNPGGQQTGNADLDAMKQRYGLQ